MPTEIDGEDRRNEAVQERTTPENWLDGFFNQYYHANPVSATFIGVHDYDTALPRFSATTGPERQLLETLESGAVTQSDDVADQLDLLLARAHLKTTAAERDAGYMLGNPCLYISESAFGIISLFLRDYAPLDERLTTAAARLAGIPALLEDGYSSIDRAPDAWIERAIAECDGAAALLREGLPKLIERAGAARPDVLDAGDDALQAFEAFRARLVSRAGTQTRTDYGVGAELFDWLLREAHFLNLSGDDIVAYARGELAIARAELDREINAQGYADWAQAAEAMAGQHPSPADYLPRFMEVWNAAREYAIEHDLLSWPEFPITFDFTPEWARTAAPYLYFLPYRCPPPVDDGQIQRYLVPPLGQSPETVLRTVNETQITLNHVIHHAGIGHHVQNWHAARARSRIGRMAGNDCALRIAMTSAGTLVEGWACYATDLMEESGFLTPLQRLSMRHSRVRMCARAIVDVELHAGRFSLDDAVAFYGTEAGMPLATAHGEAVKNSMFPTMAMIYLIGTDLIHDLRGEMEERWRDTFSLRRFHDEFLSWGAVPVTLIGQAMRGEPLGPRGFSERFLQRERPAANRD